MPAHRKLTDEQIRFARAVMAKRREVLRMADAYPTLEELAEQTGCTPRHLRRVLNEATNSSTGNALTPDVLT